MERAAERVRNRNYRASGQGHDHGLARAERLIRMGCEHFGVEKEELRAVRGPEPRRLAIVDAIWRQTNLRQDWIAERLGIRIAANVSQQLRIGRSGLEGKLGRAKWKSWIKNSRIVG